MPSAEQIKDAVANKQELDGLNPTQKCLWLAGVGQWDAAHDLCQGLPDPDGSWLHAYLHREEGDLPNAGYWYSRAGKQVPSVSLEQEWADIVDALA